MKKRVFSMTLVLFMMLAIPAPALASSGYTDMPSAHWAQGNIESCTAKGLMQGVGGGRFDPEGTLTRAQVAQICYSAYKSVMPSLITNKSLDDVAATAWYRDAMYWIVANGIMDSDDSDAGQYCQPDAPADRKYVALALYRIAGKLEATLPEVNPAVTFPDIGALENEYQTAIGALQQAGVISGFPDGRYGPDESLTRAQAAKLFDAYTGIQGLGAMVNGEAPAGTPPETGAIQTPDEFYSALDYYAAFYGFSMEMPITQDLEIGFISDIDLTNGNCTILVKYYYTPNMTHEVFAYYVFDANWNEITTSSRFVHDLADLKPVLEKYANPATEKEPAVNPPTTNWPSFSGENVWWGDSIYQEILNEAATKDGVVTHTEVTKEKVVIYIAAKWPVMRYTRLTFSESGFSYTRFSWSQRDQVWYDNGTVESSAPTVPLWLLGGVHSEYYYYKDREPWASTPESVKFPWE